LVLAELKKQPSFTEPEVVLPRQVKRKRRASIKKARARLLINLAVYAIAFAVIGVTLCVKSALMGYEIVELKREIARLESENSRLEYTIAELSSLERVQAEAEKRLGMFKPQPENMVALLYEPRAAEVTEVTPQADAGQQVASVKKKDYQFISSILDRVGIAVSF